MANILEKKLEFSHFFTQMQGVQQLYVATKKNLKENKKGNRELDTLWEECCTVRDPEVAYACADAIISLTDDGLLDGNKVISTSVNYSSSAKDVACLLYIIAELIQKHCSNKDSTFSCPFGLRVLPHPFISVLNSRPNSWNAVQEQIEYMLGDLVHATAAVFEMLRPIILYILLTPLSLGEVVLARHRLLDLILRISSQLNTGKSDCSSNVLKIILWPAIAYSTPNVHTILFYKELALKHSSEIDEHCTTIVVLKLLKFCKDAPSKGGKAAAIKSIKHIVTHCKGTKTDNELMLFGMSHIVAHFPISVISDLVELIQIFLEDRKSITSAIHLEVLMVTMLQLQLPIVADSTKNNILGLWNNLFSQVKEKVKYLTGEKQSNVTSEISTVSAPDIFVADVCSNSYLIKVLAVDQGYSSRWLIAIEESLANGTLRADDAFSVQLNLAALFLHKIHLRESLAIGCITQMLKPILKCLGTLAQKLPKYSYSILPVAVYALKQAQGNILLDVCHLLPSLASHAFCVSPILNVIKMLSSSPSLKVTALRLMLDLWMIQDRCYPQLQKMLTSVEIGVGKRGNSYDFNVLKAVAIATICKERPHQYGSDMLKLVNPMIASHDNTKCGTLVSYFALDAILQLCKSKVLNLITMWEQSGPLLQSKDDGLLAQKVLHILSLLPSYKTSSSKFEDLQDGILRWIWSKLESKDPTTFSAALCCLSHFPREEFKIKHLPRTLRPEITDGVTEEEFLDKQMPGSCFLKLLMRIDANNITAFGQFLSSVVKQELRDLPRDIHHRAMKSQLHASQPKPLKAIPEFVMTSCERNKQPNLKSSLSSSLLLSYSCNPDLDSAGKAVPKSVVSIGRKSMDVMQSLLKDITIEPNNWKNLLWCAHGWKVFMKRCVTSMLEGRYAELLMQKGKLNSSEEMEDFQHKEATALLWCRDRIANALKNASKGNPSMQGNAVFALVGLISAMQSIQSSVEDTSESIDSEYVKMSHWTLMALDTAMSIGNPKHISSGRIMSWCQYRAVSATGKLSTTQLGKICAIHAFPHLSSAIMQKHSGKILEMLAFLKKNDADSDNSLEFHRMLSLGHILSVLFRENASDHFGSEKLCLVQDCLDILITDVKKCLVKDINLLQDHLGSLLGLGLAISSKFQNPDLSFIVIAKDMISRLLGLLHHEDLSPDVMQALSAVLTWTHLSGFSNSVFTYKDIDNLVFTLQNAVNDDPTKSGYCESLGALCNGIFLCGNNEIVPKMDILFEHWQMILNKQRSPTREKLAALAGFCALAGANTTLSPTAIDPAMLGASHYLTKLSVVVRTLRQFSKANDPGVPSCSILLLGHLYMSMESSSSAIGSILPASYDYLPSSSGLKYIFNVVSEMVKPGTRSRNELLEVIISSIAKNSCEINLPPVNWTSVFSTILNGEYPDNIKYGVVSILLSQSGTSPICASLVTTWISPKKFLDLPETVSSIFYQNLDVIMKCQEDLKIAEFLDFLGDRCIELVAQNAGDITCTCIMDGLIKAAANRSSLPPGIGDMLHNTVERLFLQLPFSLRSKLQVIVMKKVARCAEFLPDANALVGKFEEQEVQSKDLLKSLFVRCCCTVNGTHALSMCNHTILLCGGRDSAHDDAICIIAVCLRGVGEKISVLEKMEWLQEVMGQVRKLLYSEEQCSQLRGEYLLDIFTLAVVFWSFAGSTVPIPSLYNSGISDARELIQTARDSCRLMLPSSMSRLFSSAKWRGMIQPVVDWLSEVIQRLRSEKPESPWIPLLVGAIAASANTEAYQRPSLWCKVVSTVCQV